VAMCATPKYSRIMLGRGCFRSVREARRSGAGRPRLRGATLATLLAPYPAAYSILDNDVAYAATLFQKVRWPSVSRTENRSWG
jgi:hypothetical protein